MLCFSYNNERLRLGIVKMEHFENYSTHPAVKSIDSISICMKKFGVENPCLYEIAAVFTLSFFPASFLI